ncbi:pilus assembly protein [Cupriavidus necator]|uniref:pilus assembly protein n=1 Tax=Cupriavidus necator TaxID=106590 RepID=UPI00339D65FF
MLTARETLSTHLRQAGGVTMLFAATMLLLVAAAAAAMLQMLLTGRQLAMAQLDREIAFRGAEAALADAEAELLAAAAANHERFAQWPPAGECGSGAQAGLCNTAGAAVPVWQPWLQPGMPAPALGVPLGHFTGAAPPALQRDLDLHLGDLAVAPVLPRYVAEPLGDAPAGANGDREFPRLRITAIGFGRAASTRAVVQSILQP